MSIVRRVAWLIPLVTMTSGINVAQASYAAPLSKEQLAAVYQPVSLVQFSTSLARVDSVDWLIGQLKLADAVGRDDIVESTLEQLFAVEESNLTGLFYQANMFLKRQQADLAQQTYQQLNKQAPDSPQAQNLRMILSLNGEKKADYQRAKLLAKSGRYDEAVQAYQGLFPHGMPSAALQLEYLQLISNFEGNWSKVKRGLERLNADYPGVPKFQLALADHIRKQNPGDSWILATYQTLALSIGTGKSAATSWLRALEQLPISQQVVEQYAILASYYPSDLEIQQAYNDAGKRWMMEQELRKDPTYLAKLKGLKLLEQGKTTQAEQQLRYALTTRPNEPEILGGLGKVYLRQGLQQKALAYFKRAQANDQNPDNASKWSSLIEASQYWALLDQGDVFTRQEKFKQAESAYRKAAQVDNSEPYAYVSLGALYLSQQNFVAADKAYSQAIKRDKLNGSALGGRLDVRIEQRDLQGAQSLANRYSSAQKKVVAAKIESIESELILARLRVAIANDDQVAMEEAVNDLIALQPTSPWLRLDIADVVRSMGDKPRAAELMTEWARDNREPEMVFAYAIFLAQESQLEQAISVLESVPKPDRTPSMQRNLTRLKLDAELQHLSVRYQVSPDSMIALLTHLESKYAGQILPLARIVGAWVEIELPDKAMRIYRTISSSPQWSVEERLAYGNMMVSLNQYEDFDHWYQSLDIGSADQEISASAALQFDELKTRRTLSQANLLMAQQQAEQAIPLYSQVQEEPEPFKTQAQIGMLRATALIGDERSSHDLHLLLSQKRHDLTSEQLITVATLFNELGYKSEANELNRLLDETKQVDTFTYRNSLALAMRNQQWLLAEERAYQALNSDRIVKSSQPEQASQESPSLRELYDSADDYWLTQNVKADIDKMRDRSDGHILVGWDYSARDGLNTSNQVPIEARIPVQSLDGHLLLRADYVSIDSGELEYYQKSTDSNETIFSNDAQGFALGVGWQAEDWQVDLGTTPVGFDHTTWVGGISLAGKLGEFGWRAEASRRPETSSMLSYAGMTVPSGTEDPAGTKWGGVVRSGVSLSSSWDIGGPYGFWSSAQYHVLNGEKVADNTRLGLLGGAYYKLIANDDQRLSIGSNLIYLGYDKNLGEYSLHHGGYYSPQSYVSLSLPVNYYGRYLNSWSYQLSGSISNSWTVEDAPYLTQETGSERGGGFGASLQAALEKRVGKRWYLGAELDLQRSEFYTPNHFMLYAKYTFNDRWQPIGYPPAVPQLYSQF
ncbi:cellulose synthase subunit BcsC-related outer membrane protein [Vibrio sinaloensis]|nr:cellulose synthase subunit BcsC-related outer membrane protein [Vibrio sinaloensis]